MKEFQLRVKEEWIQKIRDIEDGNVRDLMAQKEFYIKKMIEQEEGFKFQLKVASSDVEHFRQVVDSVNQSLQLDLDAFQKEYLVTREDRIKLEFSERQRDLERANDRRIQSLRDQFEQEKRNIEEENQFAVDRLRVELERELRQRYEAESLFYREEYQKAIERQDEILRQKHEVESQLKSNQQQKLEWTEKQLFEEREKSQKLEEQVASLEEGQKKSAQEIFELGLQIQKLGEQSKILE